MYARREKQKPFRPSASFRALETNLLKFEKTEPVDSDDDLRIKSRLVKQDFPNMIDAETGEPLQYTKAKWTPQEGRLSMNARTIIDMGTGKLDLKNRTARYQNHHVEIDANTIPNGRRHPLIDQFLAEGPLTPMYHVNWDPLTNEVDHSKSAHSLLFEDDEHIEDNLFGETSSAFDAASALTASTANSSTSSTLFLKRVAQPAATVHRLTSKKPIKPLADVKQQLLKRSRPIQVEAKEVTSSKPEQSSFGSPVGLEESDRFPIPIDLGQNSFLVLYHSTLLDL